MRECVCVCVSFCIVYLARIVACYLLQVFRFIDGKLCSETEAKSLVTQLGAPG